MKTKICSKCKTEKDVSEFRKRKTSKDGLRGQCRECEREWAKKYHQENKECRNEYGKKWKQKRRDWFGKLKKECELCPENRWWCLDFHHRNSDEKIDNVAKMIVQNYSKKRILEEIEKCQVLCANCHRDLHHNMGW